MINPFISHGYKVTMEYATMLVSDIPDEKMTLQPHGLVNHPAWILGHLAHVADMTCVQLEKESTELPAWKELFGGKGIPSSDRAAYPSKEALVKAFVEQHERVLKAIDGATEEQLAAPVVGFNHPWFPSKGALAGMIVMHNGTHIGQLSSWRRVQGYKVLF